jgi:hypothetical protein
MNQVFKPNLVQIRTEIRDYKSLARSVLTNGGEVCKRGENRVTAAEMKFMGRTGGGGCTRLDCKENLHIMKELM